MDSIKELSTHHHDGLRDALPSISLLNSVYSMDKIARCWVDVADSSKTNIFEIIDHQVKLASILLSIKTDFVKG